MRKVFIGSLIAIVGGGLLAFFAPGNGWAVVGIATLAIGGVVAAISAPPGVVNPDDNVL